MALASLDLRQNISLMAAITAAISAYLEDERKGGGILEDVVSHQADLLAWLFDTEIQKVRANRLKERDPRWIELEMVFANGFTATCVAGHAANYEEKMVIQVGPQTFVLHPTGILQLQGRPSKWVDFSLMSKFNSASVPNL